MVLPKVWKWTATRYKAARLIASGVKYDIAAAKVGIAPATLKRFMYESLEFRSYVDKLTLENELISRAGASRLILTLIEEKLEGSKDDKETALSLLKYLHEMGKDDEDKITELKITWN